MKGVDKCQHYVGVASLSVFRGNFVLAKGTLGPDQCPLFEVERCPLLGGSKCISCMVKSIGGQVSRPLYRGCPLFGESIIRGFAV